jgi:acetylornithine deacetylase/succinyl-diaminopimelate desuccinylase-like protein
MDVRGYIDQNAPGFFEDLRPWLTIPSIPADPARHADVRRSAEWLAEHLRQAGFPVAEVWPTGVEMALLLKGAEAAAYLWAELANAPCEPAAAP